MDFKKDFKQGVADLEMQHEGARAIADVVAKYYDVFESRGKGYHLRGIFFSLSDVFPEDRGALRAPFTSKKKKIESGGAKVFHGGNMSKGVQAGKTITKSKADDEDCDGCNEEANVAKSTPTHRTAEDPGAYRDKRVGSPKITEKAQREWKTVDNVLESFQGNETAMRAFAQSQGITIHPFVKKIETIAKTIFEHYQDEQAA